MRQPDRVRGPLDPKPDTCTEALEVYEVGISGKVLRLTLGDLPICPDLAEKPNRVLPSVERRWDGLAEVSRGHSRPIDPSEGPNMLNKTGA